MPKRNPNAKWTHKGRDTPKRQTLTTKDLEGLDGKIEKQWGWKESTLRAFQSQGIHAQLLDKDAVVYAGTGFGKTAVVAGPHVHPKSKGKVTIMVSPLIALQDEQVSKVVPITST